MLLSLKIMRVELLECFNSGIRHLEKNKRWKDVCVERGVGVKEQPLLSFKELSKIQFSIL